MEYIGIQKKNGGVVEALQQAILSGQIPAGTEMTQNELAESLGVSRMPVREALMILEYQGLIIRLPNNRIKAADLTEETLRQVLALGAQLERQAMRALPQDAMLAGGEMLQLAMQRIWQDGPQGTVLQHLAACQHRILRQRTHRLPFQLCT